MTKITTIKAKDLLEESIRKMEDRVQDCDIGAMENIYDGGQALIYGLYVDKTIDKSEYNKLGKALVDLNKKYKENCICNRR